MNGCSWVTRLLALLIAAKSGMQFVYGRCRCLEKYNKNAVSQSM